MSEPLTEAMLARLPKAARQRMIYLEHTVRTQAARLAEAPADSRVIADPHATVPRPLGSTMHLRLCPTADEREWIDITVRKGYLDVYASADLAFTPRSGNGAQLRVIHHSVIEQVDRAASTEATLTLDTAPAPEPGLTAADDELVRKEVLDTVKGQLTELYFKNSGMKREIRDDDAEEITTWVMEAFSQARDMAAERRKAAVK